MVIIAALIGKRPDAGFKQVIAELKAFHFTYNPASKEWTKEIEDAEIERWIDRLTASGIKAYIKEDRADVLGN